MTTTLPEAIQVNRNRIEAQASAHERLSVQNRMEPLLLAFLAFGAALAGSIYLIFWLHLVTDLDALSRVLNAYYTIFSPKFHLAAIGFVWNPLPSLVELPLVALHRWFPALLTWGFAGNVVSALSSAVAVYFLDRILFYVDVPVFWRCVFAVLYMVNPLIWEFSSNGMSEAMMIATMLGALSGALGYLRTGRNGQLIGAGLWLAACFGARYEAIPYAMAIGLAFFIAMLARRYTMQQIQANLILAGFPIVFSVIIWVLINWMIMGDPWYFLHSSYSNAAQIATGSYQTDVVARDDGHLFRSLLTVVHFTWLFPPVIFGSLGALLIFTFSRRHRGTSALLLAAMAAIPLFQVVMIDKHASAIWARFFIMYIPTGILLTGFVLVVWTPSSRILRHITLAVAAVGFVGGSYATLVNVQTPVLGRGTYKVFPTILSGAPVSQNAHTNALAQGKNVANYINQHPHMVVLLDTFDSGTVIPFIQRTNQVVITSDLDFQSILLNPRGRVSDFLVPDVAGVGRLDAINQTYPGLWQDKVTWAVETAEFPGPSKFKLFAIQPSAP